MEHHDDTHARGGHARPNHSQAGTHLRGEKHRHRSTYLQLPPRHYRGWYSLLRNAQTHIPPRQTPCTSSLHIQSKLALFPLANPMDTQVTGKPCTKLVVPSIGSTTHVSSFSGSSVGAFESPADASCQSDDGASRRNGERFRGKCSGWSQRFHFRPKQKQRSMKGKLEKMDSRAQGREKARFRISLRLTSNTSNFY